MQLPQPQIRDYSIAGTICLLMMLWALSILQGAIDITFHKNAIPLLESAVATIGYVYCIQQLLKMSRFATYLWVRFVERRDLVSVGDEA